MFGLGNGSIVWAEQFVPSGLTAVIMATGPFWMVGVEAALPDGERLSARHILGLALGFAGVVLLVGPQMTGHGTTDWRLAAGLVVLQVGCAGWALGSSYFLRRMQNIDPFASAAMQMIAGGLVMGVMSFAAGERHALDASVRSVAAIVYLALAGATAGFAFYMFALKHLPVSFVGLYAYVNPVIAVALGTLLLGERFDWRMASGVAVILAGMAVVTSKPAARRPVAPVIQGPRPIDSASPAPLRNVS
jgi:drug/metabolite transporter (DMT)-like permease